MGFFYSSSCFTLFFFFFFTFFSLLQLKLFSVFFFSCWENRIIIPEGNKILLKKLLEYKVWHDFPVQKMVLTEILLGFTRSYWEFRVLQDFILLQNILLQKNQNCGKITFWESKETTEMKQLKLVLID